MPRREQNTVSEAGAGHCRRSPVPSRHPPPGPPAAAPDPADTSHSERTVVPALAVEFAGRDVKRVEQDGEPGDLVRERADVRHAGPARNSLTSAANSAWCWNKNPCAESG